MHRGPAQSQFAREPPAGVGRHSPHKVGSCNAQSRHAHCTRCFSACSPSFKTRIRVFSTRMTVLPSELLNIPLRLRLRLRPRSRYEYRTTPSTGRTHIPRAQRTYSAIEPHAAASAVFGMILNLLGRDKYHRENRATYRCDSQGSLVFQRYLNSRIFDSPSVALGDRQSGRPHQLPTPVWRLTTFSDTVATYGYRADECE